MNNADPTIPMAQPPISSSHGSSPQDELLERGAFAAPITPGTIGCLDRFEILRLLGEGGMGQVYLAREPRTDTQVALKVVRPQVADDPQAVHRFLTEARHMYRLSHPHILRVLEVSDRKEGPYYIMPYIEGGSLLAQSQPGRLLPDGRIFAIARQVAEALAYAHAHGLIHRDIKLSNVLLDREGNAYLTDFGLVRTVFDDTLCDDTSSHLEGTVPYLSPAVARGEAEDTRCDIYAFGALLYELLAGQPPYSGRSAQIILNQIRKGPPSPIRSRNPKANPTLTKISEHCMARELRDRYASMADVVTDLERASKGRTPFGPLRRLPRIPRAVALALGALAVACLLGASVILPKLLNKAKSTTTLSSATANAVQPPASTAGLAQLPFICSTNDGAITLDKYTGPGGAVVLPRALGGLPVAGVGDRAFEHCAELTAVAIPGSITRIGNWAFHHCSLLTNVTITTGVAILGERAFSCCTNLTQVTIPASVTSIGANPFHNCGRLRAISVEAANPAFSSPGGVLFDKSVTYLINYPGGKAGDYEIPSGVTRISHWAFYRCTQLTRVAVPASVTSMEAAFGACCGLSSIAVDAANATYSSSAEGVVFNKEMTRLVCYPCGRGGTFEVPNGVVSVAFSAFEDCHSLTGVTMPESVTTLETGAFRRCYSLTDLRFKGRAPKLGGDVFKDTSNATVYYRAGMTGWNTDFGGRPTAVWTEDARR